MATLNEIKTKTDELANAIAGLVQSQQSKAQVLQQLQGHKSTGQTRINDIDVQISSQQSIIQQLRDDLKAML